MLMSNINLLRVVLLIAAGSFNQKVSVSSSLLPVVRCWIPIAILFGMLYL